MDTTQQQRTLEGDLPIAHIQVEVPILDGEPVIGFGITATDYAGGTVARIARSAGSFANRNAMCFQIAHELARLLHDAGPTKP